MVGWVYHPFRQILHIYIIKASKIKRYTSRSHIGVSLNQILLTKHYYMAKSHSKTNPAMYQGKVAGVFDMESAFACTL